MAFVEDDDMIQKLPAKAADYAFDIGVGLGRRMHLSFVKTYLRD